MLMSTTNAIELGGMVGTFRLTSVSGGAFFSQPIVDLTDGSGSRGNPTGCLKFPSAFVSVFVSRSTNTFGNDAVSVDTVLFGLISFSGPLTPGTYDDAITMFADVADAEGVIAVDTVLVLDSELSFNDPSGGTLFPTYSPACFAVTIGEPCPIELAGDLNDNGTVTSADVLDLVHVVFLNGTHRSYPCLANSDVNCSGEVTAADIIYLVNHVFKSGPDPCEICAMIRGGAWECEP
jgi:hypothetical protein